MITSDNLAIDKNQLDVELMQQSQNFYEVSAQYADAVNRRDTVKKELKEAEAAAYFRVKQALLDAGDKATEAATEARVLQDEDCIDFREELLAANLEVEQLSALKDAFIQRSYVLKDLVALFISGYFADSAIAKPKNSDKQTEALRVRLNNKRRKASE